MFVRNRLNTLNRRSLRVLLSLCLFWLFANSNSHDNHISEEIVEAVHCHNHPEKATHNPALSASVQVAEFLVRNLKIKGIEKLPYPKEKDLVTLEGWKILFGEVDQDDIEGIKQRIDSSVERLGQTLKTII